MEQNLSLTQGDEKAYNLTFSDGAGVIDISGSTVVMTLKRKLTDTTPALSKTVTNHTDPTNGKTTITLLSTDTDKLDTGNYYYDIQISGGTLSKQTILKGRLSVGWQVTV